MKYIILFCLNCIGFAAFAQDMQTKLAAAMQQLSSDVQCKHAAISVYVVNSKTGEVIFDKNSELGLAPASCQKVITSASAFELLGKGYRYKTRIYLDGKMNEKILVGGLIVEASGDPTLGSWRFESTKDTSFFKVITDALKQKGIDGVSDGVFIYDKKFDGNNIPRGWVWEDIGNYYGAGASAINWHENQYDVLLSSGDKVGDDVKIDQFIPESAFLPYRNFLKSAAKGTGDNAYIFLGFDKGLIFSGTIPVNENGFKISGAIPAPIAFFRKEFNLFLQTKGYSSGSEIDGNWKFHRNISLPQHVLIDYFSPPLDSINYWFLKKSINLYGEAFVKTIAYEKTGAGTTESGINIIKDFWKDKGIDPAAINIIDGSGLSPANRVTTNALVTVMQYAKRQPWFSSFYYDLPEANGIKMKDGYITGVRSYTGYIKSADGKEYTFSFIINNFDGSAATVREKMWRVLDILK